jgi:hypothetical protein
MLDAVETHLIIGQGISHSDCEIHRLLLVFRTCSIYVQTQR